MKIIKLRFVLVIISVLIAFKSWPQSAKALFHTDTLILYGADCSVLKIAEQKHRGDDTSVYELFDVANKEIPAFRTAFAKRSLQYRKFFKVKYLSYDSLPLKSSRPLSADGINISRDKNFVAFDDKDGIRNAVQAYNPGVYKSGVAVVFFPTCIDELKNKIGYYIVYFDIATKRILIIDRMVAELSKSPTARGAELWNGGIINMLNQMPGAYDFWTAYPR